MNNPPLVYLASPYTHSDPEVEEERFREASRAAAWFFKNGYHVYAPIPHTHPIAVYGDLEGAWGFWQAYDRRMIGLCDMVVVLMLGGWAHSTGVTAEIAIAEDLHKQVEYMEWPVVVP